MASETEILLETGTNELEIIEFVLEFPDVHGELCSQSFGINVAKVREIIRMPELTRYPGLDPNVLGVFSLRDQITPALDLARLLYGYENVTPQHKMIVSEFNSLRVGFIVRDVKRIHRLSWTEVEPPDVVENLSIEDSTVIGIVRKENRMILMLDVEKAVSDINPELGLTKVDVEKQDLGKGKKVIIAEDSAMIRHLITDRLKAAGFDIVSYHNGKAAWEALQRIADEARDPTELREKVDLLITDIEMPMMDGYTLTRNVKENKMLRSLPVVIFSSMITDDARHKGESVGADMQLSKPEIDSLLEEVSRLIAKKDEELQ